MAGSEDRLSDYARSNLERGAKLSGVAVAQAHADLDRFRGSMRAFFEEHDVLLTPMLARGAFPHGQIVREIEGQPINAFAVSILFTTAFSLTNQPAASVPTGFDDEGMPTAIQIVGRRGEDATVFRVAAALEEMQPWADRRPPLD